MNCKKCNNEYSGPICPECGTQESITDKEIKQLEDNVEMMEIVSNKYIPREPTKKERRAEKKHIRAQKKIQKAQKKSLKAEQKLVKAQDRLKKTKKNLEKSKK